MKDDIIREQWREWLRENRNFLTNFLRIEHSNLLADCLGDNIINDKQYEAIKTKNTHEEKAEIFIDMLMRIDKCHYKSFMKILEKNQPDLVADIQNNNSKQNTPFPQSVNKMPKKHLQYDKNSQGYAERLEKTLCEDRKEREKEHNRQQEQNDKFIQQLTQVIVQQGKEHQKVIEQQGKEHQKVIEQQGKEHQEVIEQQRKEHQEVIEQQRKEHQEVIEQQRKEHQEFTEQQRKEHQEFTEQQRKEHQEQIEKSNRQLRERDKVLEKHREVIEKMDAQFNRTKSEMEELLQKMLQDQTAKTDGPHKQTPALQEQPAKKEADLEKATNSSNETKWLDAGGRPRGARCRDRSDLRSRHSFTAMWVRRPMWIDESSDRRSRYFIAVNGC